MELVYPMFVMVLLTAVVGVFTAVIRIRGAYAGKVDPRYFKLMGKYDIPDDIAKFGRNFDNLFEVPVLFYVASVTALALNISHVYLTAFAWAFVAFRLIHSVIHLTYNHPIHRFFAFIMSFNCTIGMWLVIVLNLGS